VERPVDAGAIITIEQGHRRQRTSLAAVFLRRRLAFLREQRYGVLLFNSKPGGMMMYTTLMPIDPGAAIH
jgi:hypothetical protein